MEVNLNDFNKRYFSVCFLYKLFENVFFFREINDVIQIISLNIISYYVYLIKNK